MGKTRRFKTAKQMENAWIEYRKYCNERTIKRTEFSQKLGEYITAEVPSPITCTLKGFCHFIGMTEQNFYETYSKDSKFESVIARAREECELDAREKFETGAINSRLAGLWMSNYGYTTKTQSDISGTVEAKGQLDSILKQLEDE